MESLNTRRKHVNLLLAAAESLVQRTPFRSIIIIISLVAILFPFLAALSISEGIKTQSRISVEEGADFYVTGDAGGSSVPILRTNIDRFQSLPGVSRVIPRIVGRGYLGDQIVTLVGMPNQALFDTLSLASGRGLEKKGEVIVGDSLDRTHGLTEGSKFYLPINRWTKFVVVGVFSSQCSIWGAKLIYMSLEDAGELFRMNDTVTDLLIYANPGDSPVVSIHLQQENQAGPPLRIQSRELVQSYLQKGFDSRTGVLTAYYIVAFALSVPLILVVWGLGSAERKKEIALLKAVGWETIDVIEMTLWEDVMLSLAGAAFAFLLAFLWIKGFNGFFISQFFLAQPGLFPDFTVPSRFLPVTAFMALFLSLALTLTGSLYYTWRTAITPPVELLR